MTGNRPTPSDRTPIVEQGRVSILPATDEEECAYWLYTDADDAFPVRREDLDDVAGAITRLRDRESDRDTDRDASAETTEITCHECGKTWQHAESTDRATCPDCGATTPVEGIGP